MHYLVPMCSLNCILIILKSVLRGDWNKRCCMFLKYRIFNCYTEQQFHPFALTPEKQKCRLTQKPVHKCT